MYKPVPLPKSSQYFKNHWYSYSPKIKRDVSITGQLDYEFWLTLELDNQVISFCERPVKANIVQNKKVYSIQPNFWVRYSNGKDVFILITYKENSQNIRLMNHWCHHNDYNYQVLDKSKIRSKSSLIRNAKMILPYLHYYGGPAETELYVLKENLNTQKIKVLSLLDILKENMPIQRAKQLIFSLIVKGDIKSNINESDLLEELEVWS